MVVNTVIGFEDLIIPCIVGVEPQERDVEQEISLDLKIAVDCAKSVENDEIADALDYDAVASFCVDLIRRRKFFLLETLAHKVAEELFNSFPISEVFIRVKKPGAIRQSKHALVEVSMSRGEK